MTEHTGETGFDAPDPPTDVPAESPTALAQRITAGEAVRILDLRDRDEVAAWQIDGPGVTLTQLPLSTFVQAQVTDGVSDIAADIEGEGPITAVCAEGAASAYVAGLLSEQGFQARNLAGGMEAWAEVYLARQIGEDPTILQFERPATGCLAYVVVSDGEAAVVDPLRTFTDRYLADVADLDAELVAVLDSHLHADHLSGRPDLAAAADATAYVPAETAERGVAADQTLADGDTVQVGKVEIRAVALPGHTTDMTGYAVGDVLLTGDSLFLDAVARPDLQAEGDIAALAADLHRTLTDRLAAFGDATTIAPGHHRRDTRPDAEGRYVASLGDLRDSIEVFDRSEQAVVERLTGDLPPEPANASEIVAVNRGAATVDDETAFELELGPNNCAASPGT
ncbi:MBL fold metallo-hydrolase [Halobacteriales archaeon Cl-PHB]